MYSSVIPIGIIVHVVLLLAVFDIYFISPIHHGMRAHKSDGLAYAERMVLFVADGLRAESLYTHMATRAPFLHSMLARGTHGISHCQVPTESRPGHASILGGVYEDPSAIGRGWAHNPVEYDTVINESENAWCWGSPDIIDMFNKDGLPHIHLYTYGAHEQDFSRKENASNLDKWVFERFHRFLVNSRTNANLYRSGNLFFLHLLGLDTAGHTLKPISEIFLTNIKYVDVGIENITKLLDSFFQDNKTAYLFTSDHGMTDWGSHGSGSKYETEVPIIAWGAGININRRSDLNQVDIAPLIASLLHINIPVNSEGILPLEFLNMSKRDQALNIEANAKQMSEKFLNLHNLAFKNTVFFMYKPYAFLNESRLMELFIHSRKYVVSGLDEEAIILNRNIIDLCLDGISYYNGYYRNMLLVFVTTGFVGWMIFLIINIMRIDQSLPNNSLIFNLTVKMVALLVWLLIYVQSLPIMYYIYSGFPIITWWAVLGNRTRAVDIFNEIIRSKYDTFLWVLIIIISVLLLTFTFFNSAYLSFLLIFLCWYNEWRNDYRNKVFMVFMHILAIFPMVYLTSVFSVKLLLFSLVIWLAILFEVYTKPILLIFDIKELKGHSLINNVIVSQFMLLLLAAFNVLMVEWTISINQGLYVINQLISWSLFFASLVFPCFSGLQPLRRLLSIIIALSTIHILMSSHLESFFMVIFCYTLLQWTITTTSSSKKRQAGDNVLLTLLFMAFVVLAFFGTGNIADISFFNPMWTRCFISVFRPFTMSGLIFMKLAAPFMATVCAFRVIITNSGANSKQLFMQILFLCDCMLLQFLFMVKNQGSWLDIGLSLSRFIIADVIIMVIILFYAISHYALDTDLRYILNKIKYFNI